MLRNVLLVKQLFYNVLILSSWAYLWIDSIRVDVIFPLKKSPFQTIFLWRMRSHLVRKRGCAGIERKCCFLVFKEGWESLLIPVLLYVLVYYIVTVFILLLYTQYFDHVRIYNTQKSLVFQFVNEMRISISNCHYRK